MELSRREVIAAGAAAGAALAFDETRLAAAAAEPRVVRRIDFSQEADAAGWGRGWRTTGVANLRRAGGLGVLEAGSDVFPNDPRPVVFAVDCRLRDVEVAATIAEVGSAPGVVVRRRSPTAYYAAVYDTGRAALRILRRNGAELDELASTPVPRASAPVTLKLSATGKTELRAELVDAAGVPYTATAKDQWKPLARAGDIGVLATAETLFPSDPNPVLPALGNLHLLPWGVQEGQAFLATPAGQAIIEEIRRRSTAAFREIVVSGTGTTRVTAPTVIAATTGRPVPGGAELHIASDMPARATIELSYSPRFRRAQLVRVGRTDSFAAATETVRGLKPGRRVYWRARLRRAGRKSVGPVRSFRVPPVRGSDAHVRVAVAACAAQFGPIFEHLAAERPDVFVWQGDLNYPDTHGPLAQTTSAYAGIWRDFLANPVLEPVLRETPFAVQRDDHDFGVQDANKALIAEHPWGVAPWDSLMSGRSYYRFPAGTAELWVLDQRTNKTDPEAEDGPEKTLLGARQRRWLFESLTRSRARFKVICSPCTIFLGGNSRDGNWSNDFETERDMLLEHIDRNVSGTTIFLTGDTHLTGVFDSDGRFEARAAPVGIPTPNDITLLDPFAADKLRDEPGVVYAGDECHLTLLDVRGDTLGLRLLREDGATVYERSFKPSRSGRRPAR
jgi:phosphodiesterase/alkaline phosphatase D-like protein